MKRIISVLLVFSLLFGCAPVAAFGTENEVRQDNAINTGDVSIEGTNTMGKLLSEAIEDDMDETGEQMTGYSIQDLTFDGSTAFVTYSSLEAATLVVAIYTEDGMQLLGSAKNMVSADETQVTVTLEMDMPAYFYASAYLLDTYDMSPLCAAFDTPMYTREMQELLESTVEDYDQDLVVQLDDSNSTNFVVYNDSIRVVEYKEGVNTVAGINEESYTYVIENADSNFSALQIGDIVAYSYDADNILIIKVASISINGTTVTLTGEDMDIEEVFSHVKIEKGVDTQGLSVDESVADEGVSYEKSPATRSEGAGSTSASKKFNINMHYFSIKVEGSIGLQVNIDFSYYISLSKRYVDFKVDTQVGYEISVGGEVSIDVIKLPSLGFAPVPGLFIGLEPVLQVEFSGAMTWSASASFVLAASYVSGKGLRNHSSTPKVVNNTTEFSGAVFVGIDLKPHVAVVTADLLSLGISLPVGIEMEAVQRGTDYETYSKNPEKIHGCKSCLDISVDFVGKAIIELTLLKLTFDIELVEIPVHLFDCYYSITHSEFGFGKCPNVSHRVSIHVKTTGSQPVANVEISAGDQILGTTNKKGVLSLYLPEDMYDFSVKINDDKITESKLVNEACKVLLSNDPDYLKQKNDAMKGMVTEDAIKDLTPIASGSCGTNMRWVLYGSGELRLTGSGNMQSYAQNDFPWINYHAQIKSVYVSEGITGISSNAFMEYTSIQKVILPNSITSIGSSAFKRCTGLTEIRLPVDYAIHTRSFMGCTNVESIHYTPGATGKMQDRASSDTSEYWYADTLEYSSSQSLQQVYFEDGIKHIASYAFYGCTELATATLPSSLESLGRNAFYDCSELQGIDLPKALLEIGAECFYGCSSITNAMLPEGLTALGERAFYQCSALENVNIPSTLNIISDQCFYRCISISSLTIPDSITAIRYNAFGECTGLTEIRLPVDYTVHTRPFRGCSNVRSIHYTPGATGKMQDRASSNTSEHYFGYTLENSSCQTLQQVYFEEGILSISSHAFYGCNNATFTFAGDAPSFTPANYCNAFKDATATVYYPAGNSTWTDSVFQNYGGTLTWVPYGSGGSSSYSATGVVYQIKQFEVPALHAIYSGEYGTVIEQEQTVKTASFSGLVPGEQYVMLALLDANAQDMLGAENLIAIDQAQALEDGTLIFRYIQREHADTTYVIACGASNKNLTDAAITFPYMAADGTTNAVDPTVIYEQNTLREGLDYVVVGTTDYESAGTYTCYVRGINNYSGLVKCAYTVSDQIAAVYVGTTQQSTHASFAEAVQAAESKENAYIKLLWDIQENTTVSCQVHVDLNGNTLSGITVTGQLYGMDSSTDDYNDDDAGSLVCAIAQGGQILTYHRTTELQYGSVKRYVAVPNEKGYSFHRLYLGITHQTVKPATDGVGYKAIFAADDTLKAYLDNYGYRLQLGDNDAISASKDGAKLVSLDTVTLRIDNYDVANYGETELKATVFVTLADGTVIEAAQRSTTLRALVEAINEKASSFTTDQLSALKTMIEKHEVMRSWNVSNI